MGSENAHVPTIRDAGRLVSSDHVEHSDGGVADGGHPWPLPRRCARHGRRLQWGGTIFALRRAAKLLQLPLPPTLH